MEAEDITGSTLKASFLKLVEWMQQPESPPPMEIRIRSFEKSYGKNHYSTSTFVPHNSDFYDTYDRFTFLAQICDDERRLWDLIHNRCHTTKHVFGDLGQAWTDKGPAGKSELLSNGLNSTLNEFEAAVDTWQKSMQALHEKVVQCSKLLNNLFLYELTVKTDERISQRLMRETVPVFELGL
ncbi:MAG: hypothetical protein Q9201_000415 [Fulgogasparrea decipioides]